MSCILAIQFYMQDRKVKIVKYRRVQLGQMCQYHRSRVMRMETNNGAKICKVHLYDDPMAIMENYYKDFGSARRMGDGRIREAR